MLPGEWRDVIPREQARDALLFRLVFETGPRIGEALGAHVENLDLTRGDESLTVLGKGGRKRTVLLGDPRLVNILRRYLRRLRYTHGPLFQATRMGEEGVQDHRIMDALYESARSGQVVRLNPVEGRDPFRGEPPQVPGRE